jgi:hypothetical protein
MRDVARRITGIAFIVLEAGCSSASHETVVSFHSSDSLYQRQVMLSFQNPNDKSLHAKLVAIAQDGTTTIQVQPRGDILRATPGAFFAPGPYGTHGLQLVSASATKGEATLLRTWCESK